MRAEGFRSGDVGVIDEAGWLYLVDRKKDMIVASGFKVWPREVEDVLYSHPAVREAAVVGIPDAYRGETVKAVVSLHPRPCLKRPNGHRNWSPFAAAGWRPTRCRAMLKFAPTSLKPRQARFCGARSGDRR
jgi:non-ribosomal peptide synthetase component E (peptide arylation enzyme)